MAITSPQELFMHELADIYDAEQRISQMLPVMAQEAQDAEIKKALEQHLTETKQQINNLEQCFQALGQQPKGAACWAIDGLKKEHDSFVSEGPSPEILAMFDLRAAEKTEHYEIASYRGMIDAAVIMGQNQCAQLLKQNLEQEEAMAERVVLFEVDLGKQITGQVSKDVDVSDIQ